MAKYISTVFVFFSCGLFAIADDKLLEQLIQSHKEMNQYFKTIRCDVENFQLFPEKHLLASGNYLKSGNLAIVNQGNDKTGMDHYLIRGGEIRCLGRSNWEGGEPTFFKAVRYPKSDNRTWCDVWTEMLLNVQMPDGSYGTMDEFLLSLKTKPSCRKITVNGSDFIELKANYETPEKAKINSVFIFDVSKNYLVSKSNFYINNSGYSWSSSCVDWFELSKSVYFPKKVNCVYYSNQKKASEKTAMVSNLKVNEPIPEELLSLPPMPDGTILTDMILKKEGPVDSNWQWIDQPGKWKGPIKLSGATLQEGSIPGQSESEPWSGGTLLTLSGIFLLGVSGLTYFIVAFRK